MAKGKRVEKMKDKNPRGKKGLVTRTIALIILILLAIAGVALAIKYTKSDDNIGNIVDSNIEEKDENVVITEPELEEPEPEKIVNIFKGDDRPIAVMIDNVQAALPQAGLQDAYLVYEIVVEGGETRLMAVFKGKNTAKIGPVRSARHYYLDYALENDAIFVHYGWSPKAQSDISTLGVKNINGVAADGGAFWRDNGKVQPHNAFTSMEKINSYAGNKKYTLTSDKKSLLNYSVDEITLENGQLANVVKIPYSSHTTSYEYDETTRTYKRFMKNSAHKDWITNEQYTVKNILIQFVKNVNLNDGENKGRQDLNNIGKFDGYYITNGNSIKITAEKASRQGQTIYKDLEGNEIVVNDGNTYIQICPINANVVIE